MSYHIYTTRGLVLSSRSLREADRIYAVLTRDLGLIRATAGGVRKEVSKLRAALEPLSLSSVSFVKGKDYWRVTSAALEYSITDAFRDRREILESLARAFSLVEKLVVGESTHPELFDKVTEVLEYARENGKDSNAEALELVLVARTLFELGYLPKENIPGSVADAPLSPEVLREALSNKKAIVQSINSGIQASGLAER